MEKEIEDLKVKHEKQISEMEQKIETAYRDKKRIQRTLELLQNDYNTLTHPKKRSELISDTIDNYKSIVNLLDTSELEKEIQMNAVNSLVGMYDLGSGREWVTRKKVPAEVQTEEERSKVEQYLMKTPY